MAGGRLRRHHSRALFRLVHESRERLANTRDPDVGRLNLLRQHGQFFATRWSAKTIATLHPSAVLRGQDDAEQARLYALLRDDLRLVAAA